mmetsp:Transcript_22460/g.50599  ORF Transcript_22460/g.50599 Transcript_22460/m.50599 type:complete len:92 (-) Transcript_22460:58-333(-)
MCCIVLFYTSFTAVCSILYIFLCTFTISFLFGTGSYNSKVHAHFFIFFYADDVAPLPCAETIAAQHAVPHILLGVLGVLMQQQQQRICHPH